MDTVVTRFISLRQPKYIAGFEVEVKVHSRSGTRECCADVDLPSC